MKTLTALLFTFTLLACIGYGILIIEAQDATITPSDRDQIAVERSKTANIYCGGWE